MELVRTELAWAAGFFDGEGCTAIDSRRRCVQVGITQTEPTTLERFRAAVSGIGKVCGPYPPQVGGRRELWRYRAGAWADVQAIVAMLWPFLSQPKRDQAKRVLLAHRNYQRRPVGGQKKELCPKGHQRVYLPSGGTCRECHAEYMRSVYRREREARL